MDHTDRKKSKITHNIYKNEYIKQPYQKEEVIPMCLCEKCYKLSGFLVLALAVLLVLKDLQVWDVFGLSWYTLIVLVGALVGLASGMCKDCKKCRACKVK